MKELNSVLLEGRAMGVRKDEDGNVFFALTVRTHGLAVLCMARSNLGELCLTEMEKPRNVRIVGQLFQLDETNELVILAEHVELKTK